MNTVKTRNWKQIESYGEKNTKVEENSGEENVGIKKSPPKSPEKEVV